MGGKIRNQLRIKWHFIFSRNSSTFRKAWISCTVVTNKANPPSREKTAIVISVFRTGESRRKLVTPFIWIFHLSTENEGNHTMFVPNIHKVEGYDVVSVMCRARRRFTKAVQVEG